MNYSATSNQHHALAPLPLQKDPLVATVQEDGRTTKPIWMFWKKNLFYLPGFQPQIMQPIPWSLWLCYPSQLSPHPRNTLQVENMSYNILDLIEWTAFIFLWQIIKKNVKLGKYNLQTSFFSGNWNHHHYLTLNKNNIKISVITKSKKKLKGTKGLKIIWLFIVDLMIYYRPVGSKDIVL